MKKLIESLTALVVTAVVLVGCGGDNSSSTAVQGETKKLAATIQAVPSDYITVVQQLYIAYFGRPADAYGLANFSAALANTGVPTDIQSLNTAYTQNSEVRRLIDSFGTSPESLTLYQGGTSAFVTSIYTNVLGRSPDPSGLSFWIEAIDHGGLTKANASFSIMAGALANTTPQGMLDAALVRKRVLVANEFTAAVTTQVVDPYRGDAAAARVRRMLAGVTATTDEATYRSLITSTLSALLNPVNEAPVANAGSGRSVYVGSFVQLDGSDSYDPNGDSITYTWSGARPPGSSATLTNTTGSKTAFIPDVAGTYTITLTVSDNNALSASVNVVITATANPVPVAISYHLYGGAGNSQYLGCLSCNAFAAESVCNSFGSYGSTFSSTSIWNQFGAFGSQFASYSPWSSFTSTPPVIVGSDGRNYGYFGANQFLSPRTTITAFANVLSYFNSSKNISATRTYACG